MESTYQKSPNWRTGVFAEGQRAISQLFCVFLELRQQINEALMIMATAHIIYKNFRAGHTQNIRDFSE